MYKDYIAGVLTIAKCIFMNLIMMITKKPTKYGVGLHE